MHLKIERCVSLLGSLFALRIFCDVRLTIERTDKAPAVRRKIGRAPNGKFCKLDDGAQTIGRELIVKNGRIIRLSE